MNSISKGLKSPLDFPVKKINKHEISFWFLIKEDFFSQKSEVEIFPEFRMKENLFSD